MTTLEYLGLYILLYMAISAVALSLSFIVGFMLFGLSEDRKGEDRSDKGRKEGV